MLKLNGRIVVEHAIEFNVYPEDTRFQYALYQDDESELSDDDLDELANNYADFLHEQWHENQLSNADFLEDWDA